MCRAYVCLLTFGRTGELAFGPRISYALLSGKPANGASFQAHSSGITPTRRHLVSWPPFNINGLHNQSAVINWPCPRKSVQRRQADVSDKSGESRGCQQSSGRNVF